MAKDAQSYPIDLESEKVAFLQQIADRYQLADMSKAVRCLVNYARDNPERLDDIFREHRCLDC
jgi:hypothetical protein